MGRELTEEQKKVIKKIMESGRFETVEQTIKAIEQCSVALTVWLGNVAQWIRDHAKELEDKHP